MHLCKDGAVRKCGHLCPIALFLTTLFSHFFCLFSYRLSSWSLPRIHVYAFSTHVADPVQDIIHRSAGILQCTPEAIRYGKSTASAGESEGAGILETVPGHECSGHIVRDVAPKKVMVCLSFTLPEEVKFLLSVCLFYCRFSLVGDWNVLSCTMFLSGFNSSLSYFLCLGGARSAVGFL